MACKKLKLLDIVAFVVTILAISLEFAAFFVPSWWSYDDQVKYIVVGVYMTTECSMSKGVAKYCVTKSLIEIEGGLEWLFIARTFLVFSTALCFGSLLLQILFVPLRREGLRSTTIYSILAAGLFCLGGSITFSAKYTSLERNLTSGLSSVQFPFGLAIAAGFALIGAATITAFASFRGTRSSLDDDDDDEEDFQKWRAEQNMSNMDIGWNN